MSMLSKFIEKGIETGTRMVPLEYQVKGSHVVQSVKQRLSLHRPIPVFVEKPIPDVATLSIDEIDVSNPFLYRQDKWESYFKRLRDECPVHYQKQSPIS